MDDHPHSKPAAEMDDALDDSFPASDPPAWNMGRERRPAPDASPQIRNPAVVKRSARKRGAGDSRNQ